MATRAKSQRASYASLAAALLLITTDQPAAAAELKARTAAGFDRYVRVAESQMQPDASRFLWPDRLPAAERQATLARLRGGQLIVERIRLHGRGNELDVPEGLVHHWLGVVFVPGATVGQALALLQDYDRHDEIYAPAVAGSRLLTRNGDAFKVSLRFFFKKVLTVVVNSEHEARFVRAAPDRAHSRVVSTRIAEVDNPDTPREAEKPVGRDGGYLWRLNSYWRFLERDEGTYVQCETISLTRDIPIGFGWLIGPFVTSIPRDSLTFTLETTRKALLAPR